MRAACPQGEGDLLLWQEKPQAALLTGYLRQLQQGDATNQEGHAAKVYFNALFGMEFSRALPCPVNAALNYGYGLILSAINREICAAGYLTQLFTALLRHAQETMAEDTFRLSVQLQEYLGKLAALADYPVVYEQSENLLPLLKAMEFRVDLEDLPPHETLYEYLSLLDRLLKDQCFVLVQAKTYFSEHELLQLYSMAQYRKWNLLLLEAHAAPRRLEGEVHRLYDADLCELLDP